MIDTPFRLKTFLQQKNALIHWQYLVLALAISFGGALVYAYASIRFGLDLMLIPIGLSMLQGFLAFLYMPEKGDPRYIFYSLLFSFLSFFLGKYLLYVHYYDWLLAAVVNKDELSFSLLFFYLKAIDYSSIEQFFSYFKSAVSLTDILTIVMIILSSTQYLLLYQDEDSFKEGPRDKNKGRRIRRRFTGQHH